MRSARNISFGLLAAVLFTYALAAFVPTPTFACSCALMTIGELDPARNQVYVATAGEPMPDGTPMAVERWFAGPGAAPVVLLGAASFGDSAGCGTTQFAPGSRWIVSAWAGDPTQPPRTGLCQPHAPLDSPEGQAMLAEAAAAYGDGSAPEGGGGPSASPTAAPSAPGAPTDATPMIAVGGIVLVGALALGIVYVVGRGRTKAD